MPGLLSVPGIGTVPPDGGTSFRADGRFYRVEPHWAFARRVQSLVSALFVSGLLVIPVGIAMFRLDLPPVVRTMLPWVWICVAVLSFAWAWIWPGRAYRRYLYRVDAARFEIRRGLLWREVLDVPRNRIQHTDVAQGPIERIQTLQILVTRVFVPRSRNDSR